MDTTTPTANQVIRSGAGLEDRSSREQGVHVVSNTKLMRTLKTSTQRRKSRDLQLTVTVTVPTIGEDNDDLFRNAQTSKPTLLCHKGAGEKVKDAS